MKLSRKMLGFGSAVAVAGALAVTGISAAAASGSQPFVYVSIITTNPANNAPSSIILRGSITDGGVNHPGNTVDTAVSTAFPGWSTPPSVMEPRRMMTDDGALPAALVVMIDT